MSASKVYRIGAAAAVSAIAGMAAVVSYSHIYDLGRAHAGTVLDSRLLPLIVDGTILAMSLVLLHEATAGERAPALAWCMLGAGVLATLAANVTYGYTYGGTVGAALWSWPAVAFVGSVEVLLRFVRKHHRTKSHPVALDVPVAEVQVPAIGVPLPVPVSGNGHHPVPDGAREAAQHFAADLAAGTVPGVKRIRSELHVGQPTAQEIRAYLEAVAP
jgi:hypothetical protein